MGPADFRIRDWIYRPTAAYGGPKLDEHELPVRAVELAPDRRRIFLALDSLAAGRVVHLEVLGPLSGASGPLWSREAWYTLNRIPRASRRRGPRLSCGASRRSIRRMTPAR